MATGSPPENPENPAKASPFETLSLEHTSTVDRVAEELRRAVFDGELESGTPLREVAIAEALDISRPTVREALALLVADGLAVREPNRGVSVTSPDPESVRDVSRARAVLETAGVRHWREAEEHARQAVRTALESYKNAVTQGATYQQLNDRHLAVHTAFVGLLGSERLVAVAAGLSAELRLALAQIDRTRRNSTDQAGSHTLLVRMLEHDDVERAAEELTHHLRDAETAIVEALAHNLP